MIIAVLQSNENSPSLAPTQMRILGGPWIPTLHEVMAEEILLSMLMRGHGFLSGCAELQGRRMMIPDFTVCEESLWFMHWYLLLYSEACKFILRIGRYACTSPVVSWILTQDMRCTWLVVLFQCLSLASEIDVTNYTVMRIADFMKVKSYSDIPIAVCCFASQIVSVNL